MLGTVSQSLPNQPLSLSPVPLSAQSTTSPPVKQQVPFKTDSLQLAAPKGIIPTKTIQFAPPFDMVAEGKKNTTRGYSKANMPVPVKTALEPALKILDVVEPEIARGLRKLGPEDIELSADGMTSFFQKHEIYAAWVAIAREGMHFHFSDMVLDNHFWDLTDGEKAAVLLHEFVHSKETPVISHFEKLFGTIKNAVTKGWGDPVEDRAYLKQWECLKKLGIDNGEIYWTVRTYLEERNLWKET